MTPESANPCIDNDLSLCQYRYASRRRCRLPVTPLSAPFCHQHSAFRPDDPDSINLAPTLLGDLTEIDTAQDMKHVLGKLFLLLAQNRISTKKAATLTYILQQLLRTLPAIEHELNPSGDDPTEIVIDVPRPVRTPVSVPS
ncbi:MAG: hypothetical protein NVS9B13_09520 [Candidatus Acidiferrum sp.]